MRLFFFGAFFVDDHDLEHVFDFPLLSVSRSRVPFFVELEEVVMYLFVFNGFGHDSKLKMTGVARITLL